MKKVSVLLGFLFVSAVVFSQEYVAVDYYKGEHYVLEDKINVRSEPTLSGSKMFQLNTGDKVKIIEYDNKWEWISVEGVYSPWYKISCSSGEGYICARYVSGKECVGDFDCDGKDEIFACVCYSESKNNPIREYRMSYSNWDDNHEIIKNGQFIPIRLSYSPRKELSRDIDYKFVSGGDLSPKVNFLVAECGFGDGGGGWKSARYYYYSEGQMKYFTTTEFHSYECASDLVEGLYFGKSTVTLNHSLTYWENKKPAETWYKKYSWNGKEFREIR